MEQKPHQNKQLETVRLNGKYWIYTHLPLSTIICTQHIKKHPMALANTEHRILLLAVHAVSFTLHFLQH